MTLSHASKAIRLARGSRAPVMPVQISTVVSAEIARDPRGAAPILARTLSWPVSSLRVLRRCRCRGGTSPLEVAVARFETELPRSRRLHLVKRAQDCTPIGGWLRRSAGYSRAARIRPSCCGGCHDCVRVWDLSWELYHPWID